MEATVPPSRVGVRNCMDSWQSRASTTATFSSSNKVDNDSTSAISGTPQIVTGPLARMEAGIKATVAFFAPLILTSPFS